MAIGIINMPNTSAPDSDYLGGRIKDDTGINDGTPINVLTNGDIQEFFSKLMNIAGIVPNGLPDSEYTGHQLIQALLNDTGWILVTVYAAGTSGSQAYYRRVRNRVYLRGYIAVPLVSAWAGGYFTLPVGFRPVAYTYTIPNLQIDSTTGVVTPIHTIIGDTGPVSGFSTASPTHGATIYLDGLSFSIDN